VKRISESKGKCSPWMIQQKKGSKNKYFNNQYKFVWNIENTLSKHSIKQL